MKLIIAGGRDFGNHYKEYNVPDEVRNEEEYNLLCEEVIQIHRVVGIGSIV